MKTKLAIAILAITPLSAHAAPWVDQWLSSKTSTGASYYDGQERGFATFGSFSARVPMSTQNPISVAPPYIKSGCGGIDVFRGGISFLDPDYLVKQLEGVLVQAPFVAFDMALKTMCNPCADTMKAAQELSSYMNGLTLNDCAMSKRLVAVAKTPSEYAPAMWDEISQGRSLKAGDAENPVAHKSQTDTSEGKSTVEMKDAILDCSADFLSVFQTGNLLENLADKAGMTDYVEVMRGYLGDIKIDYDVGRKLFTAKPLDSCPKNKDAKFDGMVYGTLEKLRLADNTCVDDDGIAIKTYVSQSLVKVADAYKNNTAMAAAERAFLNDIPFPIASVMKRATLDGVGALAADQVALPMAYLYAGQNLHDLFTRMDEMLEYGQKLASSGALKAGGNPDNCRPEVLAQPIHALDEFQRKSIEIRKAVGQELQTQLLAIATTNQINSQETAASIAVKTKIMQRFKK